MQINHFGFVFQILKLPSTEVNDALVACNVGVSVTIQRDVRKMASAKVSDNRARMEQRAKAREKKREKER